MVNYSNQIINLLLLLYTLNLMMLLQKQIKMFSNAYLWILVTWPYRENHTTFMILKNMKNVISHLIEYVVLHTSCRSESSYSAWSFGQWFEFRMIFIMLQYNRLWSCFSCHLANTIFGKHHILLRHFIFIFSVYFFSIFGSASKAPIEEKNEPKIVVPFKSLSN